MKLRIRGNSLRLRLTQGEVGTLAASGRIEDTIVFGPSASNRLRYALACDDTADHLVARYGNNLVEVAVPTALAKEWTSSDRVGLSVEQPIGEGEALRILIEKDFACLKPREGEGDEDAFPNPNSDDVRPQSG